ERPLAVLDEVDEHVHGAAVDLAGDLAAGHELDPELGGAGAGRGHAVEAVVVGEGHSPAAGVRGQLRDPVGRIRPVRDVGVGVEIDHRMAGYGRALRDDGAVPQQSVWDDSPKDACGVFGVYAPGQAAAHLTYAGLYALQHRG